MRILYCSRFIEIERPSSYTKRRIQQSCYSIVYIRILLYCSTVYIEILFCSYKKRVILQRCDSVLLLYSLDTVLFQVHRDRGSHNRKREQYGRDVILLFYSILWILYCSRFIEIQALLIEKDNNIVEILLCYSIVLFGYCIVLGSQRYRLSQQRKTIIQQSCSCIFLMYTFGFCIILGSQRYRPSWQKKTIIRQRCYPIILMYAEGYYSTILLYTFRSCSIAYLWILYYSKFIEIEALFIEKEKNTVEMLSYYSNVHIWILFYYGVALRSTTDKMIGRVCKRALSKRLYSAKETYNFQPYKRDDRGS